METESASSSSSKWIDYLVPILLVIGFGLLIYWWLKPAPDLSGTRVEQISLEPFWMPPGEEGARKTEADLKGKITLISFWSTGCGPCLEELPQINAIYNQFQEDPKIQIWATLVDDPTDQGLRDRVAKLFDRKGVSLPVYTLSGLIKPESIVSEYIPAVLLVGPDGKVAGQWVGGNKKLEAEVVELVDKLKKQ